jgi:hypothetical protein
MGAQLVEFLARDAFGQPREFGMLLGSLDPSAQQLELSRELSAGRAYLLSEALRFNRLLLPAVYHFERRP